MIEEAFLDENFWEESDLDVWFRTNYRKLGFTEIRSSEGFADYIGIRVSPFMFGAIVTVSSNATIIFFLHLMNPKDLDFL